MKHFKKIFAMILVMLLVFSIVGCNDENSQKESSSKGPDVVISSPSNTAAATSESTGFAENTATSESQETATAGSTAKPTEPDEGGKTAEITATVTPKPTETARPTTAKPTISQIEINVSSLAAAQDFDAAGYSDKILLISTNSGVSIGSHNLRNYCGIIISYGADPAADISSHKVYLKDAAGNEIASDYLESSNGAFWAQGIRDIELYFDSSYSGELYISKDEPGHNIAISAISFISNNGAVIVTPKPTAPPTQVPQGDDAALIKKIMQEAQIVTDFARDNNFIYGDAQINPAINWRNLSVADAIDPKERVVSCDRLVSWVLFRAGFTDYQNYKNGAHLHSIFKACNFEMITNVKNLQAGDIVFIDTNGLPGDDHVFLCASSHLGNNVYLRYDHGSNERIQCRKGSEVTPGKQPFKETISGFLYAYRPNASNMPTTENADLFIVPSKTAAIPSSSATTIQTVSDYASNSSGWGEAAPSYKYTPGSTYSQFEFHLNLKVTSSQDAHTWNSCYIGARLPSSGQEPTRDGGVWLAFKNNNKAYLYAGINQEVNNWNQVPLATISLPEAITSEHKIIVVDDGELIKFYMLKTNGSRVLLCTVRANTNLDKMSVWDANNKMIYTGKAVVNSYGFFKVWSHQAVSTATNIEIKAV